MGFTKEVGLDELVGLARERGVAVMDDLGSGCLVDLTPHGLAHEPLVQASLRGGAQVATFSGDKLLGGPQAGLIVGGRAAGDRIRRSSSATPQAGLDPGSGRRSTGSVATPSTGRCAPTS